jgi:hypothetical protein
LKRDTRRCLLDREILTWDGFGEATRDLSRRSSGTASRRRRRRDRARRSAPRGAIAYGLGVKSCGALNVEFYTGIGTVLEAPAPFPRPRPRLPARQARPPRRRRRRLGRTSRSPSRCWKTPAPTCARCASTSWLGGIPRLLVARDRPLDRLPWSARGTVTEEDAGARRTRRQRRWRLDELAEAGLIDAGGPRRSHPSPDIAALGERLRAETAAGRHVSAGG